MSQADPIPARPDVPFEQTWDLASIYPNLAAWEAAYQAVEAQIPELARFQGHLGDDPQTLLAYFQACEKIYRELGKVYVYAGLNSAVDSTDQAATAQNGQAASLSSKVRAATAFSSPEIMAIGFARLGQWQAEWPALALYRHYFERLEDRQQHIRSGEVEEVLAMTSDPLNTAMSTYRFLTDADLSFKPARAGDGREMAVEQGTISSLLASPDRELRRTAWESYADSYLQFKNTLANCLTTAVKRDVFMMRARGYASSLEAALSPNKIAPAVFHNLIDVFQKNLPTWHRYWRIRRQALAYEQLHFYDTLAPLTTTPPVVPFQQAVDWIAAGMAPLGENYVEILRRGCLEERWVDWAINKGKRAGAFSSGVYDTHPFILMSYSHDLLSLSTLAHELGHSLHSYFSRKSQPYVYADYSLFVAEVASNFNQALTRAYLFESQTGRDFQIALIEEAMANFRRYFFIMPTLARFELEMHRRVEAGAPVNADSLISLMAGLFQEGFGREMVLDHDRMGITWAQFGHLYANFYVYQYATGIAGAHALAEDILQGQNGAAERYLEFLKAGGSLYPLEALRRAGVDLASPAPVEKTFARLGDMVDRLERLIQAE